MNETIQPLGLPTGSIRALLALVVVIVSCQQILSGIEPNLLLSETLMIVLTHYFTTRRYVNITKSLRTQLENRGELEKEENPLWLPRGSIRSLISIAFGVTVILLITQGRLFDTQAWAILVPFAAYLIGGFFRQSKEKSSKPPNWFRRIFAHLLALIVVFVGISLLYLTFSEGLPKMDEWEASLLLSVILYYFGTR
ncbi:hypothetical protein TI05_03810 [Achromatium sp. WMS3]|nr:hypothetical protein TI05_03810 [Achromatium sp. WMS3]